MTSPIDSKPMYVTRSVARRESEVARVESMSVEDDSEVRSGPVTGVTAGSMDDTTNYVESTGDEIVADVTMNILEPEALPLNESMIEFRETCAAHLQFLRDHDDRMEEGIKELEGNVIKMEAMAELEDFSMTSDEDRARENRSSTPTLIDLGPDESVKRTPSPSFSDISSIAPFPAHPLTPIQYSHDEEDRRERERREARTHDYIQSNAQRADRERHHQARLIRERERVVTQQMEKMDHNRRQYHNERCHALGTLSQAAEIAAKQTQQIQRVNMLTNRASTTRPKTRVQPEVVNDNRQRPRRISNDNHRRRSSRSTSRARHSPNRRHARPTTLAVPRRDQRNSDRAIVTWPLDQSLVSREGSNSNSTAGVHDSGVRGARFKGYRKKQHGGDNYPSDSSDDSSSEDESSDEDGSRHNAPRRRYNKGTKRVELKPNCFNGKNWPSYRLHFLSCVEGNSWSKKMAVKVLKTKLVDDAAYVLQQRQNGVWSLKGLLGALDCRYSQVGGPNYLIRQALHYAHQKPTESLQHYVDRIMGIVWGKLNDQELEDQLALDQFLVGVIDPELQQFLGEQPRMKSLFDALKMARDWELSEQHTQARKATIKLGKAANVNTNQQEPVSSDDRVMLMRQLEKERERNRQLQINAEVDKRLRQQEIPRNNNFRNQYVRFDSQVRGQVPPPEANQHPHYQPPIVAPNQPYMRPPAPRGGYNGGRGGYRSGPPPPQYHGNFNNQGNTGGPRPHMPQDDRRGPPPGQPQGPPGPPPQRQA